MLQVLRRHVQARFDYLSFLATNAAIYVLTVIGAVFSLAALAAPKPVAAIVGAVSLVVGLVGLAWETLERRRRWAGYTFRRVAKPYNTDLSAPVAYQGSETLHGPHGGSMLVSTGVGVRLDRAPVRAAWEPEPFELPRGLRATAPHVLSRRRRGGALLFNGRLVRMEVDVTPELIAAGGDVPMRPVRFFDGECSNDLFFWRIEDSDTGHPVDLVDDYLADSSGRLVPLAGSRLANVVGVSTLAVTSDRHLVLVLQSARAAASQDLWAPSGSGSLEPRDLKACRDSAGAPTAEPLLRDVVVQGMQRELCEECALPPDAIAGTTVIGFGRWLDRGGKPEFFGVTRLRLSSAELGLRPGGEERLWTQRIRSVALAAGACSTQIAENPVSALLATPDVAESMSLPLYACIHLLARALNEYPQLLDREFLPSQ